MSWLNGQQLYEKVFMLIRVNNNNNNNNYKKQHHHNGKQRLYMFKIYIKLKYYVLKNLQKEESHPDTLTVLGHGVCQLRMQRLGGPCNRRAPCYICPPCCLDSSGTGGMPCSGGFTLAPRTTRYLVQLQILAPSPPLSSLARTPMRMAAGEDTSLFSLSLRGYGFPLMKLKDFPLSVLGLHRRTRSHVYYMVLKGYPVHSLLRFL